MVYINIVTAVESTATISVYDNRGALIKQQKATVLAGSNQLTVDLGPLASGVYAVSAVWNNGQMKNTVQVLKQ
jgi:hypothetical protein